MRCSRKRRSWRNKRRGRKKVEGELEEARRVNARLVSAAKELAELVDDGATEALEADLAVKGCGD